MSRRKNYMNGRLVMGPSNRELEALEKKRKEDEAELVRKMNIPPRDESRWPMPDKDETAKAASLIYTLGALAESYDGNLNAVLWRYYVKFMDCMRSGSGSDELVELIKALTELKSYLAESGNPLFSERFGGDAAKTEEKPAETEEKGK